MAWLKAGGMGLIINEVLDEEIVILTMEGELDSTSIPLLSNIISPE
jgi:hypothetical protein